MAASGKLGVLDRLLTKLAAKGHRVVLFSQWNQVLDIVEDFLNLRGLQYVPCLCILLSDQTNLPGNLECESKCPLALLVHAG